MKKYDQIFFLHGFLLQLFLEISRIAIFFLLFLQLITSPIIFLSHSLQYGPDEYDGDNSGGVEQRAHRARVSPGVGVMCVNNPYNPLVLWERADCKVSSPKYERIVRSPLSVPPSSHIRPDT